MFGKENASLKYYINVWVVKICSKRSEEDENKKNQDRHIACTVVGVVFDIVFDIVVVVVVFKIFR